MKNYKKRWVLGDLHGEVEKLIKVLKLSGFDYQNDLLIQIGDIVDRGLEPFKCMDELLKIKNLILIKGNHDACLVEYVNTGQNPLGSNSTAAAHNGTTITTLKWKELSSTMKLYYAQNIFNKQKLYHITNDNMLFVHGGYEWYRHVEETHPNTYVWDRHLWQEVMKAEYQYKDLETKDNFRKIFIGHTPTTIWNSKEPMYSAGVWNVDTGSGKGGKLTIQNIDTEEFWQA